MTNDDLYDDIQELKTASVITFLVAVYCFWVIIKSMAADIEWKVVCSTIGFVIVSVIDAALFIKLLKLQRESKNIPKDSD